MRPTPTALLAAACIALAAPAHGVPAQPAPATPALAQPAISPDGREIAFVSGGDIWTVPSDGGEARLLVAHPATESRPLYAPDGSALAFTSNRTGNGDVYVLQLRTGVLTRLTYDDAAETLSAWSRDGRWLYFNSSAQDISGMQDVYRVPVAGGTPMAVAADRYATEFFGAPSPDGNTLVVSARGNASGQWWRNGRSHLDEAELWLVRINSAGNSAPNNAQRYERLSEDGGAKDLWPQFTPDGQTVYYMSDRSGAENLWSRPIAGGAATQRTRFTNGRVLWPTLSADGSAVVFERDFAVWRYDVAAGQARAVPITLRGANASRGTERLTVAQGFSAALSGDARKLALIGRGELWATDARDGGDATRLTRTPALETQARWLRGDRAVVFTSWSADGSAVVFERDFAVWRYDVAAGQARAVPITLRGANVSRGTERLTIAQGFSAALSGDARKLALIGRGELWATDAREGGDATRFTRTAELETQARWLRDDRAVVYVSWSANGGRIMLHDVAASSTRALTQEGDATQPTPSRDGKLIAYLRDGKELRVVNADGTNDRKLATGIFPRAPFDGGRVIAWSPDNLWVAFLTRGARGFTNAHVVPASGGDARAVSFLGSSNSGDLLWTPDGTALLFTTAQRTEPARLMRVDLVPRTPKFREDRFRDLFTTTPARDSANPPAAPSTARPDTATRIVAVRAATPATRIEFEGIRERATVLEPGIDIGSINLTPDGKTLIITSAGSGQPNLYTWSLDELSREPTTPRQITTTPGNKSVIGFSADSRELWVSDAGRVVIVPVAGGASRNVAINAELDTDFHTDKLVAFEQAWASLRDQFYDATMHGVDWNAERERFVPYVRAAQTPDELRRLLQLMVGELNASHSGASGPSGFTSAPVGKLGLRFDRTAYEQNGTLQVREVITLGPAAIAGIAVGDRIIAIDGQPLARTDNLDARLLNTVGRRVELTVLNGTTERRVVVRPVNTNTEKGLLYRQWVNERRAYVAKASNGRLGYVHMNDMSAEALDQLNLDLDAENFGRDGVVIDLRNNNGGFVNAYALDVFARRGYMTMTTRGSIPVPARTQLGQRSLEKPTVLVVNQHTLSDGEDFTEGYRTLGLGKVVGEPTAGWIIYTSSITLIDGTSLRLPFIRVDGTDGKNMELVPRPVDVTVKRPVGESYGGADSQLDAAVRVLLEKLGR